ncbi:hypothetical protein KCU93_g153, partial [Aureobasidium melanogenum]
MRTSAPAFLASSSFSSSLIRVKAERRYIRHSSNDGAFCLSSEHIGVTGSRIQTGAEVTMTRCELATSIDSNGS